MLTQDFDSYYSPAEVTNVIEESLGGGVLRTALDSNCGGGALLDVVERVYPNTSCIGIDYDELAIRKLRKRRPHWTLVQGDSLSLQTWQFLLPQASNVDLAVLNPPFSMGAAKGLLYNFRGNELRCSLAMAHVLGAIQNGRPKNILAVLPASLLVSEIDAYGRAAVEIDYDVESIAAFKNSVFRGTRASSVLVRMTQKQNKRSGNLHRLNDRVQLSTTKLVRGGLPVFEAKRMQGGIPYIHSTDLKYLIDGNWNQINLVQPLGRGTVGGPVILLPRVGIPLVQNLKPFHLPLVQLSDCVIALQFKTFEHAQNACVIVKKNWESLLGIYVGTGARYLTVNRLSAWLASVDL